MDVHKDIGLITTSIFYMVLIGLTISMVFSVIEKSGVDASSSQSWNGHVAGTSFYLSNFNGEFGSVNNNVVNGKIDERYQDCKLYLVSDENRVSIWKEDLSSCDMPSQNISETLIYAFDENRFYELVTGVESGG